MRKILPVLTAFAIVAGSGGPVASAAPALQAPPAGSAVLKSGETNTPGVVAEVIECSRKDGVLTIKMRLRNTSAASVRMSLIKNRNFDAYYVTAGSKKYYVLRDSDKVPLAPAADGMGSLSVEIPRGGAYMWWGKYPAPPDSETKINYVTPLGAPFDDIPIGG